MSRSRKAPKDIISSESYDDTENDDSKNDFIDNTELNKLVSNEKQTCSDLSKTKEKCDSIYCTGLGSNGERCHLKKVSGKNYCNRNHGYMEEYTEEMIKNLKYCKGCKKWRYAGHFGNNATCEVVCQARAQANRAKKREQDKINKIKCLHTGCRLYARPDKNFCGDHEMDQRILDAEEKCMKLCSTYNRKCTQPLLPLDYPYSKCDGCRMAARECDKQHVEHLRSINACPGSGCGLSRDDNPLEFIDSNGNKTSKCSKCRKKQAEHDRKGRASGTKKSYPPSEQAKETKKLWKKNNREKISGYWLKYRSKRIAELGDKYWENNAKRAQERRDQISEEERLMNNKTVRQNINHKLQYYKQRAKLKNIPWNITDDMARELFTNKCYYCNCDPGETHNGIDRVNNNDGYSEDNAVSACTMCNMLKACLDYDIFLKRCEHILTHLGIIQGHLYSNIFPNSRPSLYNGYKRRAEQKGISFTLSENEYNTLISGTCYLCGTSACNNHINGIDRFNSDEGYTLENSRSCCTECNYLKNKYSYDIFINKLKDIYNVNKNIIDSFSVPTNQIEVMRDELYFYRKCNTLNTFLRTQFYVPKITIGTWDVINKPANDVFLTLQHSNIDENYQYQVTKITLDSDIHVLQYILISQGFKNSVECDMNDRSKTSAITYDSIVCAEVPKRHKAINVEIYYLDDKVIKITFAINSSKQSYCKCTKCVDHYEKSSECTCKCDHCFKHSMHGLINNDKCFWCSTQTNTNISRYKTQTLRIMSDDNTSKYISTKIDNNSESIKQAFAKLRKESVSENAVNRRKNLAEGQEKQITTNDIKRQQKYKAGLKSKTQHKQKIIKSAEQKREEAKMRKQKSRQAMKTKYGDDTWRKIHAKEINIQRLKQNDETDKIDVLKKEIEKLKKT